MSNKTIRALLEYRLKTWADARTPVVKIASENVNFTPPAGLYVASFLLPASTSSKDLAGSLRNRIGVFQVNIVCPKGNGPAEAQTVAAELDALFPCNTILTQSGFKVQITSPTRERSAITDGDRYTVPVDFTYRSDST